MDEIKEGYTRVSTILRQWHRFAGIDPAVVENKRRIGTNVHTAINMYNNCLPWDAADDERPYVESYIRWHEREKFNVVESEKRYYDDKLMITGAVDGLAFFPQEPISTHGKLVLCDWKCSYAEDPINWPLQAAFYQYLVYENGIAMHDHRLDSIAPISRFVKLDRDGKLPKVYEYEYSSKLLLACKSAVITYHHQKPWLDKRDAGDRE